MVMQAISIKRWIQKNGKTNTEESELFYTRKFNMIIETFPYKTTIWIEIQSQKKEKISKDWFTLLVGYFRMFCLIFAVTELKNDNKCVGR